MSDRMELTAEVRIDVGKGASRRLRRNADLVPGVVYGAGKEAVSITIPHKELHKASESESFYSQILTLKTGSESEPVILKDLQRHPARDRLMHADFYRIRMDQKITVEIQLHFLNEENCVGVKQEGGVVSRTMTSVEVNCLPTDLPEFIEVDIAALTLGSALHLSDIVLPENVEIPALALGDDHDNVVVSVQAVRATLEDDEVAEKSDESETGDADTAEGEGGDES
ncbi:MAG: 50S ribosomal protein L25/general stress protein Ctc [Gammaproteobacteria bacterium]|uniref:Large ribosomal subunit protein bL25 n=1 Tax=OM182 bacterium MED-G24 TaxID=1986255 RepID=A0A2A5WSQ9_9GAMM|nr:50S ribosomal protein L25/general stress protein Ctc [Gammaproteobacteria bacterium]PDH39441.1 MAG: 50S ribosomal protein L25/general stress protein Ctc [OM182 bacterium MED-G24]